MNIRKFFNLLFPAICILCQARTGKESSLCAACTQDLPTLGTHCKKCALSLSESSICFRCLKNPPYFDRILSPFDYTKTLPYLITALKFQRRLVCAKLLGELLSEFLSKNYEQYPDYIIPVPLHSKRLKERGFNQSIEIAKPIAKQLNIPILRRACQRIIHTRPQTELSQQERRTNIKGAFKIHHGFKAKSIAIIDDVVTTGHTVNELSRAFRKQGVLHIDIWCCARTSSL